MLPMEKGLLPRDLVGFLIQAYEAKAVRICSVKDMLKALCRVGNWVHSSVHFCLKLYMVSSSLESNQNGDQFFELENKPFLLC